MLKENNKLDADTFKGNNYKRGLKVLDEEILNCLKSYKDKRGLLNAESVYLTHTKH